MKKTVCVCFILITLWPLMGKSQSVGISSTPITPDASSLLEVRATDKGVLIPRVSLTSTTDNTTIASPATSLLVYNLATSGTPPNNVIPGYYYNVGTPAAPIWKNLGTTGSRFTVHYDNRFRVSTGTYTNYFYNSQNYGPGTEGDNSYPYRNDYLSSYYLANPTSIPSYMIVWQSTVGITSPSYLHSFAGWAMVEGGAIGGAVTNPPTVTVYFYKYTPTNGFNGNLTGTLIASGSVYMPLCYTTYYLTFSPGSTILLNPGDFVIGYVRSSTSPTYSGSNCIMTLIGEIEFVGQ